VPDDVFARSIRIGDRAVGPGEPVLIIAEAGVSHFGDMGLARDLVDLAAKAGADVWKTQLFEVDQLFARSAPEWRERLRPRNLTLDEAHELKERCTAKGLSFMATAHDESRIAWLKSLDVPAIKVGSGERNNTPFLERLAELGKPIVLSTGMYGDEDVREALATLATAGCRELALLHCVTSYPTPADQVSLAAMDQLAELFPGPVGYSDHTEDFLAVLGAVARGARIIEKHITILRDVPNAQDWKVAAGPDNFACLVADIRRMEAMIGEKVKRPAACEEAGIGWATKSLVAARDLAAGRVLAATDLVGKRPGGGISPNRTDEVIGRRLKHALAADAALTWDHLGK
jgi:N-acetylneuraminate synthase/N,N'-diacetyllegionaminate synthase